MCERTQPVARDSGQSLIETALILPLLLTLVFNAVNFGYFFYVSLNLVTAPRVGAEYSIQGGQTPSQPNVPSSSDVNTLVSDNLIGSLSSGSSAPIRVCTKNLGVTGSGSAQIAVCSSSGSFSPAPASVDADPEAPFFVLHRVDVQYTVTPLISGWAFNAYKVVLPSLTFSRSVSMRAID